MAKLIVAHTGYGCDTGCWGHVIEIDGKDVPGTFEFFAAPDRGEDKREWAEQFVREQMGEEHVKDLDWENSTVVYDY